MKTIQEIETEIRRLVPRLMELSFGCRFKENKCGESYERIFNEYCVLVKPKLDSFGSNHLEVSLGDTIQEYGLPEVLVKRIEIIGHPIDLEAVLELIGRKIQMGDAKRLIDNWRYGEPFGEQPEYLREFVANILFNGK
jgi:hypothetical protein